MSRTRKYDISILLDDAEKSLETDYGFYLLEADGNLIGGERREFETEEYPEKDGAKINPVATKQPYESVYTLCCFGPNTEVVPKIKAFEQSLYDGMTAKEITLYNDAKGFSFKGYSRGIEITDFKPQSVQDVVTFEWTLYNASGETDTSLY